MINNKPEKRIYAAEQDGSCIHCGKKPDLPNAIEKTIVFENCSINNITKELRDFFECIYFENDTVKITIIVSER